MFSIIVVPPGPQIRLAPGECLGFGRGEQAAQGRTPQRPSPHDGRWLALPHDGVSRNAGVVTASGEYWSLTNLSRHQTYVVENPEGAGEHIKVAPGRTEAPVPFEFARVVLPAAEELISFDVWAPRHSYHSDGQGECPDQDTTAPAFPLDRSKRYFLALAALCEPRLRGEPYAPLPTSRQLLTRLRPVWPTVNRTALQWNIDYLAVKLRLKPAPEAAESGGRHHSKKETLAALALRFDLVYEDDLDLLRPEPDRALLSVEPGR
ncbi:FHA domain-containing protein [Streptomyces sp. NBC_01381]|uniref:FHA domain-containing protein n=1 Tax=Streptomyces sp. NBC_01381 TaxID=2903845 RepID=UPI00225559D1|nr:FHA domain-containing protein [Streptomyces sp. NBC_01381]MCX4669361.1 FHA domain-containing protein [Streptomyces sp. NBC_01381]